MGNRRRAACLRTGENQMSNELSAGQTGCGKGCACGAASMDESALDDRQTKIRFDGSACRRRRGARRVRRIGELDHRSFVSRSYAQDLRLCGVGERRRRSSADRERLANRDRENRHIDVRGALANLPPSGRNDRNRFGWILLSEPWCAIQSQRYVDGWATDVEHEGVHDHL